MIDNLKNTFKKKEFTLSIGDEGAILCYFESGKLQNRIFSTSPEEANEFIEILNEHEKAPVRILLDVSEQFYSKKELPAVNGLAISSLVKKRLKRDYSEKDITASVMINQSKTGRKNWNYIFIDTPFEGSLETWVSFIAQRKNRLKDICLLPVESYNLIELLNKKHFPKLNVENRNLDPTKKANWQILLLHNKLGGFRQVVFINGKIFFSRMITNDNEESASFIAGAMEQELSTTVEYLKTQGMQSSDRCDIYIISSPEIKQNFNDKIDFANNIIISTPFTTAQDAGISDAILENDSFADVLMAAVFAKHKIRMSLKVKQISTLQILESLNSKIYLPGIMVIPFLLIHFIMAQFIVINNQEKLEYLKNNLQSLENKFTQKQENEMKLEEATRITEIISLYKMLKINDETPLELIAKFNQARPENALVNYVKWENIPNRNKTSSVVKVTFEINFKNESGGYQKLFNSFDDFIDKIEKIFSNYDVEYSRINEKINFNDIKQSIPVKITIIGKNK